MTNNEIDERLALAIGHQPQNVKNFVSGLDFVVVRSDKHNDGYVSWWRFDHQNPTVILPIMEVYDVFPYRLTGNWMHAGLYCAFIGSDFKIIEVHHKNPRTAATLALLDAAEKGLL